MFFFSPGGDPWGGPMMRKWLKSLYYYFLVSKKQKHSTGNEHEVEGFVASCDHKTQWGRLSRARKRVREAEAQKSLRLCYFDPELGVATRETNSIKDTCG